MKTLYSMPARSRASPSRAGSSSVPCSFLLQPANSAAASSAQATTVFAGEAIAARILLGATLVTRPRRAGRIHPRPRAVAGGLERLVAGDGDPGERLCRTLLEHEAQALECRLRVPL